MIDFNLTDRFTLMALRTQIPSGSSRRSDLEECIVDVKNVKDSGNRLKVRLSSTNLKELMQARQLAASGRVYLNDRSATWEDRNWRLVENSQVQDIQDKLTDVKLACEDVYFNKFIPALPKWKEEDKVRLGDMYREEDYPNEEYFKSYFGFKVEIQVVPSPEKDVRAGWSEEHKQMFLKSASAQFEEKLERANVEVIASGRRTLDRFRDRMEKFEGGKKGGWHGDILEDLKGCADLFTKFNIKQDPRMDELRDDILDLANRFSNDDLRASGAHRQAAEDEINQVIDKVNYIETNDISSVGGLESSDDEEDDFI